MRIEKEHFEELKTACEAVLKNRVEDNGRSYRKLGVSHERFRWMIFNGTPQTLRSKLYEYMTDKTIDTALRRIIPMYPDD